MKQYRNHNDWVGGTLIMAATLAILILAMFDGAAQYRLHHGAEYEIGFIDGAIEECQYCLREITEENSRKCEDCGTEICIYCAGDVAGELVWCKACSE